MATSESRLDLASPLSPADTSREMLEAFERDCLRTDADVFNYATGQPLGRSISPEQREAARRFIINAYNAAGKMAPPTTERDYIAPRTAQTSDSEDGDIFNYAME